MKRIALITGASGGIGSAVARAFAARGYALGLQYRNNRDALEKTVADFPSDAVYALLPCDLTDAKETSNLVQAVRMRLGTPSVLVHCAGIALPQGLFSDTTDEAYDKVFDLNVRGTMRLTRLLLDDLRKTRGSIVTISSIWGVTGGSCEAVYSASKAAVIGFTKALAKEMAPSGVRASCVAPGYMPTEMNAHLSPEDVERIRLDTPLGRLGSVTDAAEAICYLAEARFVTGQVLCVDGGITI